MRNLLLFIIKNHFSFLFIFLQTLAIILAIKNNEPHKSRYLASSHYISGNLYATINAISQYFNLIHVNEELAQENKKLRNKLSESHLSLRAELNSLIDTTAYMQQYSYIAAKVINNDLKHSKNYITLNKGQKHGIKPDMAVIGSQGVVGIVKDVSNHFCTVISVLNTNYKISAKFKKNNYFGSLYWDGKDPYLVKLSEIPYHVDVQKGDTIETTSFSMIYPSGIPIGKVVEYTVSKEENFFDITVELATNFHNLEYVYIVNNLLKEEQQKLEGLN